MTNYARLYRFGVTPWERYGHAAAASIAVRFDREETDRDRPLGRALDLGCGRGRYTAELARRGWEAVGIDYVPKAIEAAQNKEDAGATYLVGDVTQLPSLGLGTFDFFLDIGCFQGLDAQQRQAEGRGVTVLANPGATLLMLAFGVTRLRSMIGGTSQAEVEDTLPDWVLITVESADTSGLGWPMNRTSPQWYRLRRNG
ncbi:MAG TPA: methyltransferase domain-containing protein [Nocardioides sp.]|jgi:SAM-dependent methyltransferase|nr:methyltransferase domain-containing protein [Nocardioides sp.]